MGYPPPIEWTGRADWNPNRFNPAGTDASQLWSLKP